MRPEGKSFRIAHISDLHFSHPLFHFCQFFSKRWLGNLNLILTRKRQFLHGPLFSLRNFLKEKNIDLVLVSGDLTTTSLSKEFTMAKEFLDELQQISQDILTLPGNHDHYTKRAFKEKIFYQFFPEKFSDHSSFSLKDHGVTVKELQNGWWMILLDTVIATSLLSSRGYFSEETEKNLIAAINTLPKNANIILANHFPFFKHESPRKTLIRSEALRKIIKEHRNIKLYLHGHTHRHTIADLRVSGFPILSDSGSSAHRKNGSFNVIEISSQGCSIEAFKLNGDAQPHWIAEQKHFFPWNNDV